MNKANEIKSIISMIKKHAKSLKKKQISQSEVYDYLDSIKVEIDDESMDEVLGQLFESGLILDESDEGDLDDVS